MYKFIRFLQRKTCSHSQMSGCVESSIHTSSSWIHFSCRDYPTKMGRTAFMGGSLSFKGEKRKSKKKSKSYKHKTGGDVAAVTTKESQGGGSAVDDEVDDDMTEAERRALKRSIERQHEENKKIAQKSHRERVEELNEHLGSLTELNDIPRVSAAGNG
jgi:protein FAM32A